MKTQNGYFRKLLLLLLLLTIGACNKVEPIDPPTGGELMNGQGIAADELETYEGQLGISISAREIARRGHHPVKAVFTIDASSGDFNTTVDIDQDTHLAQTTMEVEDLSTEAEEELRNGVPVNVEIQDENGASLLTEAFSILSFKANPEHQELDASDLTDFRNQVSFRPGVKYFMQIVKENELSSAKSSYFEQGATEYRGGIVMKDNTNFTDRNPELDKHLFTFEEITSEPGVFLIRGGVSQDVDIFLRLIDNYLHQDIVLSVAPKPWDLALFPDNYKFKFQRDNDTGLYTIYSLFTERPLGIDAQGHDPGLRSDYNGDEIVYFRILTLDIDWNIETLETKHLQPILPPPSSSFSYNSTLTNCTTGLLTQTIGSEETRSQTSSLAFEESFSMTSRETVGGSLSLSVSTEASFFGSGVEVSATASASYQQESEITSTSTQFSSMGGEKSRTFFSERELQVPPGTATVAYDALQTYENIRVPFIQRYRIKGAYQTGEGALTGDEILTQFSFTNAAGGVVTLVGSDFIELTVRGVNIVGNVIDAISRAESAEPNCN